ncbi:BNR repeat-like domain [Pelomyxa schiedti]|nr:BNR repeat-like domain [Pelomyxa schiedti]
MMGKHTPMLVVIIGIVVGVVLGASIPVPKVTYELIMPGGTFPYCHACSIQELYDGTVVAVFHAGTNEGNEDLSIWTSRRDPATGTWSPITVAAKTPGVCDMNPSLYMNDNGVLYLDFHFGSDSITDPNSCSTHSWEGAYVSSSDGGVTWSSVTYLPKGFLAGIKNKCITLSNGNVLCPSSTESGHVDELIGIWQSHMETTDQDYQHWEKSNDIDVFHEHETWCQGPIQPTLFELETPGKLTCLLRTSCDWLAQSYSDDYGLSWQKLADPTDLMNPGAGIDGVRMYGDGAYLGFLLMMNNSTQQRCPLTLAHSGDWGETWEYVADIETDCTGSYQYPAIVQSRTNPKVAHVCYTLDYGNRTMAYAKLQWS